MERKFRFKVKLLLGPLLKQNRINIREQSERKIIRLILHFIQENIIFPYFQWFLVESGLFVAVRLGTEVSRKDNSSNHCVFGPIITM